MDAKDHCQRREFLAGTGAFLAGMIFGAEAAVPAGAVRLPGIPANARWGYLIDTTKCIGCGNCTRACRTENDVPEGRWRTWVERYLYVELQGGVDVKVEAPSREEDGYSALDPATTVLKGFFVPKICNHCVTPSCVRVCPASATYVTPEGVVLVDDEWCIGCGYCIQACPYEMRFLDERHGVASKCTWCYHRVTKGMKPACVITCPTGARQFGDLRDPDDPVTTTFREKRVYVLRPETGNDPQVRYANLAREVI
jgi:Fe-S-cluster-containing dehydrogenase component